MISKLKSGFIKKQIPCGRILFYLQYFTFDAILCLMTLDIPILRFLPKAINIDKSQEKQVCWFQKLCNENVIKQYSRVYKFRFTTIFMVRTEKL